MYNMRFLLIVAAASSLLDKVINICNYAHTATLMKYKCTFMCAVSGFMCMITVYGTTTPPQRQLSDCGCGPAPMYIGLCVSSFFLDLSFVVNRKSLYTPSHETQTRGTTYISLLRICVLYSQLAVYSRLVLNYISCL